MLIVGIICLIVGIIFIFLYRGEANKVYQMKVAETRYAQELHEMAKEIAAEVGAGGYHEICEVKGLVKCETPLTSEIAKKPCVYYQMSVERKWEENYEEEYYETDEDGNEHRKTRWRTRQGSDTVASNRQQIDFWVEDESGRIKIDPDGANLETVKAIDQFQPADNDATELSFMGFNINVGGTTGQRRTLGYHFEEHLLPLDRKVYVLGEVSDSSGELKIKKPTEKDHKFVISLKSEEEMIAGAEKNVKIFQIISIVGFVVGAILIVLSFL